MMASRLLKTFQLQSTWNYSWCVFTVRMFILLKTRFLNFRVLKMHAFALGDTKVWCGNAADKSPLSPASVTCYFQQIIWSGCYPAVSWSATFMQVTSVIFSLSSSLQCICGPTNSSWKINADISSSVYWIVMKMQNIPRWCLLMVLFCVRSLW